MKILFFDDKNILSRTGVERKLGKPEIVSCYKDPLANTSTGMPSIWYDEENSLYHMFYNGFIGEYLVPLVAISEDGINFQPRNTADKENWDYCFAPNQMFDPKIYGGELAYVYEDKTAPKSERLKALFTIGDSNAKRIVHDYIYASEDGIKWTKQPKEWHNHAAEPGAMCFYNNVTKKHTIVARPDAGARRIGIIETEDFKKFTDLKLVMTPDSLDEPLVEHYGMPVFPYGDIFIGFLWIYHVPNVRERKYIGGTIDAQLVYSYNGTNFNRSLRESFFTNDYCAETAGMVFPCEMYEGANGELLVAASINPKEHGQFKDSGKIAIYKLRKDGFISFNAKADGEIITIPMVYSGGKITVNANCEELSCALFTDDSVDNPTRLTAHNLIPLDGFSHKEFKNFSGNSDSYELAWEAADLESLKGKIIYLELKFSKGDIYSINGELTPMLICDLARYHKFGILPDLTGIG